jgi:adenylate cyclase
MRPAPRRLTVLASIDVAGYTPLVERDERGTLAELAAIRRQVLRPTVANFSGNLFKTMGDGALVEFPSVEDAVRWGMAFQTAMAARNATRGEWPIRARVGIALADVFVQGNDRFGAAVGFTVRLQTAGPPGGLAITHSVRWQLVRSLAAQFVERRVVSMKGIDEAMEIFVWAPPGVTDSTGIAAPEKAPAPEAISAPPPMPSPAAPAIRSSGPPATLPSIVVLAFDNMSSDPVAGQLADGIVEEITATLSRIRDFTVIARNSAYAYKGRSVDVRTVSRELGVRYVLEGSLRKAGDRVRVTAQLVDATTGAHLWADSYDGVVDNLFDFEDRIAECVTGAVNPSIRTAEIALARRKRPENLAAYDLVLRAMPHLWAHRREDNFEAIHLLDKAIALEPDYGRASALAAWARAQHIVYNWSADIDTERRIAHGLIEKAAQLSEDDPTALTALGTAVMLLFGDLDRAQIFIDRALTLDPNHAWAWTRRGFLNVYRGNAEEAVPAFERAIRLSPLDPFSFNCHIGLGFASFVAGRYDEAVKWAQRAMREKTGMTWAYRDLAVYLAHEGKLDEARNALAQLTQSLPYLTVRMVERSLTFMAPKLLAAYVEGLRLAGLPEG